MVLMQVEAAAEAEAEAARREAANVAPGMR